ncbi:hypothetical protein [Xanthocytophaga agilis]|uniref:Uncharacterized protein n=1 Tax=Xanthocytophaga agilis TaxID=3048010 RepID=A0AAE3R2X0_9BACT|nr:hypothetical protein [Xanthocytophaga agilis]MDJ1500349.1 hypothetical protein [Xanthocytophaga agilis]
MPISTSYFPLQFKKSYWLVLVLYLLYFPGWSQNLQQGLVACYPFEGNANDFSGNSNNGYVNGATLTTGRHGEPNSAYLFNGKGNYIELYSARLKNPSYSYSLWVKPVKLPSTGEASIIFSMGSTGGDQNLSINNSYANMPSGYGGGGYSIPGSDPI